MFIDPNTRTPANPAPRWAEEFGQTVCACLNEIEGSVAGFDFRFLGPDEQDHDDYLFLFAPAPLQISGGPDDGAVVCEPITVDIEAAQQLFTDVESTFYHAARGEEIGSRRRVGIGERSITVYVFDQPFDDADVKATFDDESKSFLLERDSQR
jgi:hypothetical protein